MSKPTKRWAEARLRVWIDRLGLGHWDIVLDWETPSDEGTYAQCWRASDYDRATIHVCPEWASYSREFLEPILVHELLHVSLRDVSRANDFALKAVEDNTVANNIAVAAWKRAEEGVVDRLARALVASYPV